MEDFDVISILNPQVDATPKAQSRLTPNITKSVHFTPQLDNVDPVTDVTLKAMQRQIKDTRKASLTDLNKLKSRVHLLNKEEYKMQQKIKQTKRLSEKISSVRQLQEERFQTLQQASKERSLQSIKHAIHVEEERQRHLQAMERGRKNRELAVLLNSISIKRTRKAIKERKEQEQIHLEEQRQIRISQARQKKLEA